MKWLADTLPAQQLVLDASAMLNILGSEAAADVLNGIGLPCIIESKVLHELTRHPVKGVAAKGSVVELCSRCDLQLVTMVDAEYSIFLSLVQEEAGRRLDDGESACLAVASQRALALVLDDNKARRVCANTFPEIPVVSSLRLFISVAKRNNWSISRLQAIVNAARTNARMDVPKSETELLQAVLTAG